MGPVCELHALHLCPVTAVSLGPTLLCLRLLLRLGLHLCLSHVSVSSSVSVSAPAEMPVRWRVRAFAGQVALAVGPAGQGLNPSPAVRAASGKLLHFPESHDLPLKQE